jgi:hypothetical protein
LAFTTTTAPKEALKEFLKGVIFFTKLWAPTRRGALLLLLRRLLLFAANIHHRWFQRFRDFCKGRRHRLGGERRRPTFFPEWDSMQEPRQKKTCDQETAQKGDGQPPGAAR